MEGRPMNPNRRDPLSQPRNSGEVLALNRELNDLRDLIVNARPVPMVRGSHFVNKDQLVDVLDNIEKLLPGALKQAAAVLQDEQKILNRAHASAKEMTDKAAAEAKRTGEETAAAAQKAAQDSKSAAEKLARDEANAKNAASTIRAQAESEAKSIRDKAMQEAQSYHTQAEQAYNDYMARARMEANMIIREAEAKANAAVSEQNVYQMAVMAAKELREETEQEMANYRQRCLHGLNNLLGSADDFLLDLVEEIRRERANLANQG